MLSLVRAARQQLGRAFGVRAQWLKPLPCTGAAHTCGKHWRGDKRLVAFSFHWERQPTFCHQSEYSSPSTCGMIGVLRNLVGPLYIQPNHMYLWPLVSCVQSSSSLFSHQNSTLIFFILFHILCVYQWAEEKTQSWEEGCRKRSQNQRAAWTGGLQGWRDTWPEREINFLLSDVLVDLVDLEILPC